MSRVERVVAWVWAVLTGIVILALTIPPHGTSSAPPAAHRIRYQLTGTAKSASITIQNESGGTEQHVVRVPWAFDFTARAGQFIYLSAQNQGRGAIGAEIQVDGEMLQQARSTEEFGIATVSGRVPD